MQPLDSAPSAGVVKSQRPTSIRHLVVASAVSMSVLLYLDRFCVSLAEVYMKQDLQLSDFQIGWMMSAFFWSYALTQVPSGWLADRFGGRVTLAVYIVGWSACTAVMGLAQGIVMLVTARFVCGMFQAGAYPASAAILARWVPVTSRGLASSLVALGGRTGGALAPLLTAWLIVAFVPRDRGSHFEPSDILAPRELCQHWVKLLQTPGDTYELRLARTLFGALAPEGQQVIEFWATHEADLKSPILSEVAAVLNGLLSQPIPETVFDPQRLPNEGRRLLQHLRRLNEPESFSQSDRERLHRLAIETLFPDQVRRVYTSGWRPVMFTYGALGIPIALVFWLIYRNRPEDHPWCNDAEKSLVIAGKPKQDSSRQIGGAPIRALLTHPSMWCNSISQFATNVGWIFLVTWLPRYLDEVHRVPVELRGYMSSVPVIVGFIGLVLGGRLTDWLVGKLGLRWGRALPMGLAKFLAMFAYLLCLFEPSAWGCVVLFAVVAFASDLGIGATWAYAQDVGGRHVASVLGWANMWGNLGAAIGPLLLVQAIGPSRNWNIAFVVCATAYAVAALSALAINAEKPLLPSESATEQSAPS